MNKNAKLKLDVVSSSLYFSIKIPDNHKSNRNDNNNNNNNNKNDKDTFHVLLFDVLVGRSFKQSDVPPRNLTKDYDSILYYHHQEKTRRERVELFHKNQVLPRYLVELQALRMNSGSQSHPFGGFWMPKEEEYIDGGEFHTYKIEPQRHVKADDPEDYHFRLAESQFHRLLVSLTHQIDRTIVMRYCLPIQNTISQIFRSILSYI